MFFDFLVNDIKNPSFKTHDTFKFKFKNNLLYFEGHLYIPKREAHVRIFQVCHGFRAIRHLKYNKILELISKDF